MEPQQEADKSILFLTEIKAIDPKCSDEGVRKWSGPFIKALSWEQAEEYALHRLGYVKVLGVAGSDPQGHDIVFDATEFSIHDDLCNNSIGQGTDSTNSVNGCSMSGCCEAVSLEEDIEEVEGFADGDTVMLKSGGPIMTVRSANGNWCDCNYFVGVDLLEAGFPADCLIFVNR